MICCYIHLVGFTSKHVSCYILWSLWGLNVMFYSMSFMFIPQYLVLHHESCYEDVLYHSDTCTFCWNNGPELYPWQHVLHFTVLFGVLMIFTCCLFWSVAERCRWSWNELSVKGSCPAIWYQVCKYIISFLITMIFPLIKPCVEKLFDCVYDLLFNRRT
jgi:hypothetical protein